MKRTNKGSKPVEDTVSALSPAKTLVTVPSPAKPLATPTVPDSNKAPADEAQRRENKGNCVVVKEEDISEKLFDVLWGLETGPDFYVTINCQKTISNTDTRLPSNWIGSFPEDFFSGSSSLGPETKFDMKTETKDSSSGGYLTTFSGDVVRGSSITGTWQDTSDEVIDQSVKVISVTTFKKKIYITKK